MADPRDSLVVSRILIVLLAGAIAVPVVLTGQAGGERVVSPSASSQGVFALVGGTLIDGSGAPPISNSVVLVRGDRIQRVGSADTLPVPDDYVRVSTEGMTVLPGLWDMHVHLLYAGHTDIQYWHRTYTERFERDIMPAAASQLLQAGVTSARDLGAPPAAVFATKRRTAEGAIPGPTIYAAGPQLTHEPPEWARFYRRGVSGPADAPTRILIWTVLAAFERLQVGYPERVPENRPLRVRARISLEVRRLAAARRERGGGGKELLQLPRVCAGGL